MILAKLFLKRTLATSGLLWLAMLVFVGFFEFLRRADDYSLLIAATLALLALPQLALATIPFACAVGAAVMCRQMEEKRELTVMRAMGLSPPQIAAASAVAALVFSFAYLAVSELLLDRGDEWSRILRGETLDSRRLWLKSEDGFAQVGKLHGGGFMQDIVFYETREQTLNAVVIADSATRENGNWWLANGRRIKLPPPDEEGKPVISDFSRRQWRLDISPLSLNALSLRPRDMAMHRLGAALKDLDASGQNSAPYKAMLWRRLADLLALPLICACGIWFIGEPARHRTLGAALGGVVIGGGYFLFSSIGAFLSADNALAAAVAPTILAIAVFIGAKRRI